MRNEPMRRNDLPETCFSILPSSGQLIIIRCGEHGYYPSEWDTGSREENREIASSHNARRGITDIQEAAMLAGSVWMGHARCKPAMVFGQRKICEFQHRPRPYQRPNHERVLSRQQFLTVL